MCWSSSWQFPLIAFYVFILYMIIQNLEDKVLMPIIFHKTVHIPPAIGMISQILFASLMGFMGFILAIPLMAVIRADEPCEKGKVEAIVIESEVNIQDGVIIHALGGSPVRIRKGASLAHGAVVHGPCDLGEGCFIEFKSVVFKSTLNNGVVVLHQSLVEGVTIEAGMHVPSMTAVCNEEDVRELCSAPSELAAFADKVRRTNVFLAEVA
ncbi:MAG: AI-2E family transporter [Desulfobacterales bacterium]